MKDDEGGKFYADNIEIESQSSSVSSITSHSDESISVGLPESVAFDDDRIHDKSADKSLCLLSPAVMELQHRSVISAPSVPDPVISSRTIHSISLTERVDAFLAQVISRRFNPFSILYLESSQPLHTSEISIRNDQLLSFCHILVFLNQQTHSHKSVEFSRVKVNRIQLNILYYVIHLSTWEISA